ncbi:MAG: CRISPR-associated endonuclease Cas1 [Candidatus Methylomirabilis sp.]|nr:CRISPR-associated endonuclease Cas1 [Candidatus Methylomirabilis sp.]
MTTLYLDRSGLDLRDDQQTIAVYEGDERRQTIPIALLERVVIRGNVTLTTGLLGRLAEAGVAVALLGVAGWSAWRRSWVAGITMPGFAWRNINAPVIRSGAPPGRGG